MRSELTIIGSGTIVGEHAERRARRYARMLTVPFAIMGLVAALTLIAMRGQARESLPIDIRTIETADPDSIGATTWASIEVTNHGGGDLRPRFSVMWLSYPHYWKILSGPPVMHRGETATYVIAADDAAATPPEGEAFQIRINDARSIVYAVSRTITVSASSFPIKNPSLAFWTRQDLFSGSLSPANWQLYQRTGDGDRAVVEPTNVFGTTAVHLRVIQDGVADDGGWSHAGLAQQVAFPNEPFDVKVLSFAPFRSNAGGWPVNAFGMEVDDQQNGLIWILFQRTGVGDREYALPSGHHMVVLDVPDGAWTSRTVDLPAIYARARWDRPESVIIKLFIAAASTEKEDIEGYIAGIAVAGDPATTR